MVYSENLKKLRLDNNMTQEQLGSLINIGKKGYNHIEKEYTIISIEKLNTLCNHFNVSLDYIFGFNKLTNYENIKSEIDKKESGIRLKSLRKNYKLTQSKFADLLMCSYGTIAGYESGRYYISTSILYDICKKYHISADYLLGKTTIDYLN